MATKTEALYDAIRAGEPQAVTYYRNLKDRFDDGMLAKTILDALQAVHDQRKATMNIKMRSHIGAAPPPGSYKTPTGIILTPADITSLANRIRQALYAVSPDDIPMASASPMAAAPAALPAPSGGGGFNATSIQTSISMPAPTGYLNKAPAGPLAKDMSDKLRASSGDKYNVDLLKSITITGGWPAEVKNYIYVVDMNMTAPVIAAWKARANLKLASMGFPTLP